MKKLLFTAVAAAMLATASTALADDVKVKVNGEILDMEARIVNDRTLVPFRAVSNALGCGVAWDEETRGIAISRAGGDAYQDMSMLLLWIDKPRVFKMTSSALDSGAIMDVAPQIIEDRTFVPVRAIAELFGAEVSWEADTRTAVINAEMPSYIHSDEVAESLIGYEYLMNTLYDKYDRYLKGESEKVNAVITLEDESKIELELYPELAPITVENFVKLAKEGYYKGLTFHRVIKDFMIQGGGFDVNGAEAKETPAIKGEFLENDVLNFLPHKSGMISMARTKVPDSATGQFFIVHKDSPHLNGSYATFGKVTSGMEIVDKIANVETDSMDKPVKDVVIKSIDIEE